MTFFWEHIQNSFGVTAVILLVALMGFVWAAIKLRSRVWKPLLRGGGPLWWWVIGIAIGCFVKIWLMFRDTDAQVAMTWMIILGPLLTLLMVGIGWIKVRHRIEREHRERLERQLDEALTDWSERK